MVAILNLKKLKGKFFSLFSKYSSLAHVKCVKRAEKILNRNQILSENSIILKYIYENLLDGFNDKTHIDDI